jgi:hypothetical protein
MIYQGGDMLVGFDKGQWHHLVMLKASPSHTQISAKARLVNTSRINPGKTSLKGKADVTKELADKLGRELDQRSWRRSSDGK